MANSPTAAKRGKLSTAHEDLGSVRYFISSAPHGQFSQYAGYIRGTEDQLTAAAFAVDATLTLAGGHQIPITINEYEGRQHRATFFVNGNIGGIP